MKKFTKIVCCVLIALVVVPTMFLFAACGKNKSNNKNSGQTPDTAKWFTSNQLAQKGLFGLTEPTGLTGEMKTSVNWYGNGYAFSQSCPSEDVFKQNAQAYFEYFKANYYGSFGTISVEKSSISTNEVWYIISQKYSLEDYHGTNPSELYKFYYVTNKAFDGEYYKQGSVLIFEIRYEYSTQTNDYQFKLFIESADESNNGIYSYHYKMR